MSLPRTHFFISPLPSLLGVNFLPLSQLQKSDRKGIAVRRSHSSWPGLISCTLGFSDDRIATVHDDSEPLPNSIILVALKVAVSVQALSACLASFSVNSRRGILIGALGSTSLFTRLSIAR